MVLTSNAERTDSYEDFLGGTMNTLAILGLC